MNSSNSSSAQYAGLPDALLPTALPQGWTVAAEAPLTLTGPEHDLDVAFLVRAQAENLEDALRSAWNEVDPGFDLPVRHQGESPSTDGWDTVHQVMYASPASDERMAVAVIRFLGDRAYINLIRGSKAAVSRRMAQVNELVRAWRPSGLQEPSLAGKQPKRFGEEEQRLLREFVQDALDRLQIPGSSIAVIQSGRTVFSEGFGVRVVGGSDPVTPTTRFMIGSSTKPLTTFMMAKLVDLQHFEWQTPVRSVLPGFALADEEVTDRLTMKHTVCACTGMPRRDMDLLFRFEGIRPEDRIAEMRTMLPTTGFGETFQYSNYLVAAGGYAAAHSFAPEQPLRDAYEQAMRKLVFEPLGMADTTVLAEPGENAAPHAIGFGGDVVPIDPVIERFGDAVAPAGSIWSTALDMAEYVRCELSGGLNADGERVISNENLMIRREPGIKIDDKNSYGLGLIVSRELGLNAVTHGGNTLGFTSDMLFMPEHGIGYVVLTNLRMANAFLSAFHQRVVEILFDAPPKADAMIAAAVQSREKSTETMRKTVSTEPAATAWVADWTGRYTSEELGPARIYGKNDGYVMEFESWSSALGVSADTGAHRELVLTSAPWRGLRLQVVEGANALILDGGQSKYTFVREDVEP